MSLVDSRHIMGARERNGAHYYAIGLYKDGTIKMGMTMYLGGSNSKHRICQNCMRSPFEWEEICPRCGVKIED